MVKKDETASFNIAVASIDGIISPVGLPNQSTKLLISKM